MAKPNGPKDLLEMLETQGGKQTGTSGGFMMPAARPKPAAPAAGATASAGNSNGGFMMPAPPVKRAAPNSKANAMAPPSSLNTAAHTNKFAKVAGADASGTAGSGGGGGEALPRAAGAGPLPHAHAPLISTQGGGGAGGELSDPYDPARPNDYMAYCRERMELRDAKERQRLRELQAKEAERQRAQMRDELERAAAIAASAKGGGKSVAMPPPPPGGSGGGRGAGRGMSNLPAWMQNKPGAATAAGAASSIGPAPPSSSSSSGGSGSGGSAEQFDDSAGGATAAAAAAAKQKKSALFRNPTRILLLKNMVAPGEVDDLLSKEVAEECRKFGPVRDCVVHEAKGVAEEEAVRTLVAFERQDSAIKAFLDMEGRFFAGRMIRCAFFNEQRFDRKDYEPREDEAS